MRYYLYVVAKQDAEVLMRNSILKKSNCTVYLLNQLALPQWFRDLSPPMFADVQEGVLYYGEEVAEAIRQKSVQVLDEIED